jgi:phage shock protein PspC (stress-responsive transcriptional regulator)
MNDRLYRTVDDRVLAGVCGGLAVRLGVDPSLVRVGYAVVALLTGIFPLLVLYVIMAAVVPEQPTGFAGRPPSPAGPDAVPGWMPPSGGAPAWTAGDADAAAPAWTGGDRDATAPAPSWPEQPERAAARPMIGGLVLVGLGIYFLVRDRLDIDWGVVWAAGLVAIGVVIVIAAFRPRS